MLKCLPDWITCICTTNYCKLLKTLITTSCPWLQHPAPQPERPWLQHPAPRLSALGFSTQRPLPEHPWLQHPASHLSTLGFSTQPPCLSALGFSTQPPTWAPLASAPSPPPEHPWLQHPAPGPSAVHRRRTDSRRRQSISVDSGTLNRSEPPVPGSLPPTFSSSLAPNPSTPIMSITVKLFLQRQQTQTKRQRNRVTAYNALEFKYSSLAKKHF